MGIVIGGCSKVRVCVDMRKAKKTIVRESHPIPKIEEILYDLNGSSVFRKPTGKCKDLQTAHNWNLVDTREVSDDHIRCDAALHWSSEYRKPFDRL